MDVPPTSRPQEPPPVIAFHGCSWTNSQEIGHGDRRWASQIFTKAKGKDG